MSFLNNISSPGVEIFFVIDSPYLWTVEKTGYKKWIKKFICDTDQIVFLRSLGNGEKQRFSHNGHYRDREAPPKHSTFFRLQVYESVGISLVEVFEKVEKSIISVWKKTQTDAL